MVSCFTEKHRPQQAKFGKVRTYTAGLIELGNSNIGFHDSFERINKARNKKDQKSANKSMMFSVNFAKTQSKFHENP
jgi:hypothetical protein